MQHAEHIVSMALDSLSMSNPRRGGDVVHQSRKVGEPVQKNDKLGVGVASNAVELAKLGSAEACDKTRPLIRVTGLGSWQCRSVPIA